MRLLPALGLTLTLLLGAMTPAAAALFYNQVFGDWSLFCSRDDATGAAQCRLAAPPPSLNYRAQRNIVVIREPGADRFEVEIEIRDMASPALPAFLWVEGFAVHEAPTRSGKALWQGAEALRIIGEMRAARRMVLRVQTVPDGLPRDAVISLARFREALAAYRQVIRIYGLLPGGDPRQGREN
jgi:hypothetical protein